MNNRLHLVKNWADWAPQAGYRSQNLARLCQVSVRQLERFFHKKFKRSPHQWLRTARMARAVELLQDGSSVKETATLLGYKAVPHFTRDFKKWSGKSPTSYVRIHFTPPLA
jgi:AraC-like DNA-binding protein